MNLEYKNFPTPQELCAFVNENKIRPEQIQLITSNELTYWDNVTLKVADLIVEAA